MMLSSAKRIEIFQDVDGIGWGERWELNLDRNPLGLGGLQTNTVEIRYSLFWMIRAITASSCRQPAIRARQKTALVGAT